MGRVPWGRPWLSGLTVSVGFGMPHPLPGLQQRVKSHRFSLATAVGI